MSYVKYSAAIAVAVFACLCVWLKNSDQSGAIQKVIEIWKKKIRTSERPFMKIAVGVNANVDVIAQATKVFKNLQYEAPSVTKDHDVITSVDSLLETFAHFFSTGSAAERYCDSKSIAADLISAASNTDDVEWYVGGNAALMAQKIVTSFPDRQVQLFGPVGPKLQQLLHANISVPVSSQTTEDEFHLILEYQVGERWGPYEAHRANRFITSHDVVNGRGNMIGAFFDNIAQFKPDLVILSGLHLLDAQPPELWRQRLSLLVRRLAALPRTLPVHLELASMSDERFVESLLTEVVPLVSSVGLNEQEITFAAKVAGGPHSDLMNNAKLPDIGKIGDMVHWFLHHYGYNATKRRVSRLTRVHFHSLTYHVVGYLPAAWGNARSAVAAGTSIAGQQACDLEELDSETLDLRIPESFSLHSDDNNEHVFNASRPVVSWSREGFRFSLSPVLVCKQPLKTVGLGDAISSTGLLYSEFFPDYVAS